MAKKRKDKYPDNEFYEVRWYGRGRVLMSRNYCRDSESIQKYIDRVHEKISLYGSRGCRLIGSSPDYFITVGIDQSGIDIRKVKEARWPYNMLEDRFDQLHFMYSCPFYSMLDKDGLLAFAEQEKERNEHDFN
jgi:hypothetical protein